MACLSGNSALLLLALFLGSGDTYYAGHDDKIQDYPSSEHQDQESLFPSINSVSSKFSESSLYSGLDPIFGEVILGQHNSSKRAAWDMYAMVKCSTGCNPLVFKGYGCYCGFLGSGQTVDGIDRCCKMHDWCYTTTSCMFLQYALPYFVPYKWKCNGGSPYCIAGKTKSSGPGSCSHQLCECDREFVHCLADFPCPRKKAMCRSPWRYFQNLFMGLGTGMDIQEMGHNSLDHYRG